jgi:hypothetical protein
MDLPLFSIPWVGSILVLLLRGTAALALFRRVLCFADMILIMGVLWQLDYALE